MDEAYFNRSSPIGEDEQRLTPEDSAKILGEKLGAPEVVP